ncbi:MAG: PKD domain-containing protein [Bacteroidales bacterium]|nr:PKD domain-containing protein [Bacteroidales bacterium]
MKYKVILMASLLAAFASCTEKGLDDEGTQTTPAAPKIEFSINEEAFSVDVDSAVVFKADIVEGTNVKTVWTVDDEKVAGTPSVTWRFTKIGVSKVHFEAANDLGKVTKDYTVTVNGIPLVVTFSEDSYTVDAVVGTPIEVAVTVTGGDKGTVHEWKLDNNVISTETTVFYTFKEEEIGAHTLEYKGVNIDGMSASRSWTVNVKDMPLEVTFSPAEAEISAMEGDEVSFSTTILHGATGATYSWKVDGTEKGTESSFKYTCSAQGTFAISATVTNSEGEKAEKSWTLTVTEKTEKKLLFDDFESTALGESSYYIGNNVGGVSILQVVENPYKTSTNPSDKVLVDKGSMMTNTSSGYFKFKINTFPDATTEVPNRSAYTKIRVKIYIGETGFTPLLQEDNKSTKSTPSIINGIEFNTSSPTLDAWNAAIKTNDWNVFVYDFTSAKYSADVNNLSQTNQVQFRVFVDFNNNGKAGKDVYFDDIEFVE